MTQISLPIQTEADVEALILYENVSAFPGLISKDIYNVYGSPPQQNILFHNSVCRDLFCINLYELFAENEVRLQNGTTLRLSIFSGLEWVAQRYAHQFQVTQLLAEIEKIKTWLDE